MTIHWLNNIVIKVQAIWDSLDADSLTAENVGQQDIANLFFSVGNKLDIAQIDEFYTKVLVNPAVPFFNPAGNI